MIPQFAIHNLQSIKYFSSGQQKTIFLLALFILTMIYCRFYSHSLTGPSEELDREIVVEVGGEVRNPGIYLFKNPPSLRDAIKEAGDFKEAVFFNMESSSETLATGTLITLEKEFHREIKAKLGRMEARKLLVFSIPLDLNRASVEDLCLIPGIGSSLAQEIITYRKKRRLFRSVEELKNVKGIGEKKYKGLKGFFTIE